MKTAFQSSAPRLKIWWSLLLGLMRLQNSGGLKYEPLQYDVKAVMNHLSF